MKRRDLIADELIDVLKITAPDPLSIGGTENSIREKVKAWEADIKYHENYLYDTGLIPGTFYLRMGDEIKNHEIDISDKVREELENLLWNKLKGSSEKAEDIHYQKHITRWANLLNQPIPEIKRVSVDIEVESEEGRMPTPRDHDRRIIAVGFAASNGFKRVLLLNQNKQHESSQALISEAEIYPTEKELLEEAFKIIDFISDHHYL